VAVPGAGFGLHLRDYLKLGAALRRADLPTVFVQEGGYDLARVGAAVGNTLRGFCDPTSVSGTSSTAAGAAATASVLPRTDELPKKKSKVELGSGN
jgi:acetoin utilization deacetylase AcuC-like enzyme